MHSELKASQTSTQIKDVLVKTLKDQVISKADLNEDQKAEQAYQLLVVALSKFMAQTKLQFRVLMETRALEAALGNHVSQFDVTLMAKPQNAKAQAVSAEVAEPTGTEAAIVEPTQEGEVASSEPAAAEQN